MPGPEIEDCAPGRNQTDRRTPAAPIATGLNMKLPHGFIRRSSFRLRSFVIHSPPKMELLRQESRSGASTVRRNPRTGRLALQPNGHSSRKGRGPTRALVPLGPLGPLPSQVTRPDSCPLTPASSADKSHPTFVTFALHPTPRFPDSAHRPAGQNSRLLSAQSRFQTTD
jgi:hypothetical protein